MCSAQAQKSVRVAGSGWIATVLGESKSVRVAKTAGRSCIGEAFRIESHCQIAHVPSERTCRTFLTDQGLVCSRSGLSAVVADV